MIRGLIALFSSGTILNPMVLLGVLSGFLLKAFLSYGEIFALYGNYHFYIGVVFVAFLYGMIFKKVYKKGGLDLDLGEMGQNLVLDSIRLGISNALAVAFIAMLFM